MFTWWTQHSNSPKIFRSIDWITEIIMEKECIALIVIDFHSVLFGVTCEHLRQMHSLLLAGISNMRSNVMLYVFANCSKSRKSRTPHSRFVVRRYWSKFTLLSGIRMPFDAYGPYVIIIPVGFNNADAFLNRPSVHAHDVIWIILMLSIQSNCPATRLGNRFATCQFHLPYGVRISTVIGGATFGWDSVNARMLVNIDVSYSLG